MLNWHGYGLKEIYWGGSSHVKVNGVQAMLWTLRLAENPSEDCCRAISLSPSPYYVTAMLKYGAQLNSRKMLKFFEGIFLVFMCRQTLLMKFDAAKCSALCLWLQNKIELAVGKEKSLWAYVLLKSSIHCADVSNKVTLKAWKETSCG